MCSISLITATLFTLIAMSPCVWAATDVEPTNEEMQAETDKPRPPTPATTAYRAASNDWQLDVNIFYSGNADRDFAMLLEAHDKGAAAVARIEAKYGEDPKLLALAKTVAADREKELAMLKAWQANHE